MKNYTILAFALLCLEIAPNFSIAQISNEEKIADEAQQVIGIDSKNPKRQANPYIPDTSQMDFSFLKKSIGNKRIVILGETSHEDGGTFNIKVNVINYLKDTMKFQYRFFECSGLYDSYLFSHNLNGTRGTDSILKKYGIMAVLLSMWSNTREVLPLDSLFITGKLKLVGMDCQPNWTSTNFITSLKNYTDSINTTLLGNKEWKTLDSTVRHAIMQYHDTSDFT